MRRNLPRRIEITHRCNWDIMNHSEEPNHADLHDAAADTPAGKPSGDHSPCPICGEPARTDSETFPFCSARCRTIDLGKWISGDYNISRRVGEADLDQDE